MGIGLNAVAQSNTVPVFYISTVDSKPIVDKENYIDGEYYVKVPKRSEYLPIASAENPATLQIRGRGNATWNVVKKSYKIKLTAKTELLGMPANRHFALLACYGAAFELGMFSYMAGLKIAEMTGQPWVPRCRPVELVLNGEYWGLYLLIETVRIDNNRVNIFKQPDKCTDPELIPGGWLVEIDNYSDENQVIIPEYNEDKVRKMKLTHKNPEELSTMQEEWLISEFTKINKYLDLHGRINNKWADYIDPVSFARYFIIREMIHDTDGYTGSFFLHKDIGEDSKWICGPIWDIYPASKKTDWVMNSHPDFSQLHYIQYVFQTTAFQRALAQEWSKFKPQISSLINYVNSLYYDYQSADRANGKLWDRPNNAYDKILILRSFLYENAQWIDSQIIPENEIPEDVFKIVVEGRMLYFDITATHFRIVNLSGKTVREGEETDSCDLSGLPPGMYFIRAESKSNGSALKKILLR